MCNKPKTEIKWNHKKIIQKEGKIRKGNKEQKKQIENIKMTE